MSVTGPCGWELAYPPEAEDGTCGCSALDDLDAEQRDRIEQMAIDLLWEWTGRQFGVCEVKVRPCRMECAPRSSTFWGPRGGSLPSGSGWVPVIFGGQWWNVGCGTCAPSGCTCTEDAARTLRLPAPVQSITSILIDGQTLPEEAYTLRDGVLYRTDGGTWPWCNDDIADPEAPDSPAWEVTYMHGTPVPIGGQIAAYTLACELAKAVCGDGSCQLPSRVQSVTRQGVSMEITQTEFSEMKEGRTGIWLIDSWVAAIIAPKPSPPSVRSPDIPRGSMRGTMAGLGRGSVRW